MFEKSCTGILGLKAAQNESFESFNFSNVFGKQLGKTDWDEIVFSCFKFVELFIKITPLIIKIDFGTRFFKKICSAVNILL